jgi:hypothetical protein
MRRLPMQGYPACKALQIQHLKWPQEICYTIPVTKFHTNYADYHDLGTLVILIWVINRLQSGIVCPVCRHVIHYKCFASFASVDLIWCVVIAPCNLTIGIPRPNYHEIPMWPCMRVHVVSMYGTTCSQIRVNKRDGIPYQHDVTNVCPDVRCHVTNTLVSRV